MFQAYLQSNQPNTMQVLESIETFVKNRPGEFYISINVPQLVRALMNLSVIKTFERELIADGMNALKPLQRADLGGEGMAHPDEVKQVVMNRSGSILSASTIIKSDFFSNLQKMTLPEYVFFSIRLLFLSCFSHKIIRYLGVLKDLQIFDGFR